MKSLLGSSTAALTQDIHVDMLALFPCTSPSLAVRAGPYCKQREAGQGPWNKAIDVLTTIILRRILNVNNNKHQTRLLNVHVGISLQQ